MNKLLKLAISNQVRMTCERTDRNPNMDSTEWARHASHWLCVLRCGKRAMRVYFSQGAAHTKPPRREEVLECLFSDSRSVEGARNFEDWAADLGYDPDSRSGERTYKIIQKQTARLKRLLGDQLYVEMSQAGDGDDEEGDDEEDEEAPEEGGEEEEVRPDAEVGEEPTPPHGTWP